MASLEDIVPATNNLAKESETLMGGAGSKPEDIQRDFLDLKNDDDDDDDDGSSTVLLDSKRVVEDKTVVVEPTYDSGNGLDCGSVERGKGKLSFENLSSVSNGGPNSSVNNGSGVQVDANGSSDGFGSEKKIKDTDESSVNDEENAPVDYNQVHGTEIEDPHVAGDEKGLENGEKLTDKGHGFNVGDLVWAKIKSHPWWPGQVYDPKDASEFAVKHIQEGRLLVAFFGDGSCSWCLPSQLIPFVQNFTEMSKDSISKSFVNAVQQAIDEIGRLLEAQMTCKCICEERKIGLARPVVANAGVKAGVLIPEVDVGRLGVPEYGPAQVLTAMNQFAKNVCVENALDLTVLRSWLSAFNRFKGGHRLALYNAPVYIEGLEDKNKNVAVGGPDISVPIEVPTVDPQDDDWISSPRSVAAKPKNLSSDKKYPITKEKSVAEIMASGTDLTPKSYRKGMVRQGTKSSNPAISEKKKKRHGGEADREDGQHDTSSGKKRKIETVESPKRNAEAGDLADAGGVHKGSSRRKPKEIDVAPAVSETASGDAEDELSKASTPRERKKSKYLSPPYTDLQWRTAIPSSKMKMELGIDSEKHNKKARAKSAGELLESPPVSESGDQAPEEKSSSDQLEGLEGSAKTSSQEVKTDGNLNFPLSDIVMPVDELLSSVESAAIDPLCLSKAGSLEAVWAFISAFRSSLYSQGSNYKSFHKRKTVRKRKSLSSQLAIVEKDLSNLKKAKSVASAPLKETLDEPDSSHSADDDLISDARIANQKLEIMTAILENYHQKFSPEDKSILKEEMKSLLDKVETASERVRVMAEKTPLYIH